MSPHLDFKSPEVSLHFTNYAVLWAVQAKEKHTQELFTAARKPIIFINLPFTI